MLTATTIASDALRAQRQLEHIAAIEALAYRERKGARLHMFDPGAARVRAAYAIQRAELWRCFTLLAEKFPAANEAWPTAPEAA